MTSNDGSDDEGRLRVVVWVSQEIVPHEAAARRWVRRMVNADEADDILQESYCRIASLADVSHIRNGKAYLLTTVRMLVLERIRQPMTSVRDIEIDPLGSVIYGLYDGVDVRSERWTERYVSDFRQATMHFKHALTESFGVNGIVGYSRSGLKSPTRGFVNIDHNDTRGFSVDFRENNTFPTIKYGFDVADPANFRFGPGLPDGTVNGTWNDFKLDRRTTNLTLGANAEWKISPAFQLLVGGQYRRTDYRSTIRLLEIARQATPALPAGQTTRDISVQTRDMDTLLGYGAPASWAAGDLDKLKAAIGVDDSWYCGTECGSGDARVRETIKSGFGKLTFNFEDALPVTVRGDVGLRYVHTDQFSFGYIPVAAPAGSRYPTTGQRAVSCCRFRGHEVKLPALAVRTPWG